MSDYQRPMQVDTTRYEHSEPILKAMSTTDEYFVDEKPVDPLVLVVEALLATLPEDERDVVEMCLMGGLSMHEAARTLGYINKNNKEDHKMVKRRLTWALRKMKDTLESPSFASAIAGHKLPATDHSANVTNSLSVIISNLESKLGDDDAEE